MKLKKVVGYVMMCLPIAYMMTRRYIPYDYQVIALIILSTLEMCHIWISGYYLLTGMKPIMIVIEKKTKDEKVTCKQSLQAAEGDK